MVPGSTSFRSKRKGFNSGMVSGMWITPNTMIYIQNIVYRRTAAALSRSRNPTCGIR